MGSLTRTPHGCFPEYHTSADNLDFVAPRHLGESLQRYLEIIDIVENDRHYLNTYPKCEPQLGKHGLYRSIGGIPNPEAVEMALLWVLNQSDGRHSLLDIAERAGLDFGTICDAAGLLCAHGLLTEIAAPATISR